MEMRIFDLCKWNYADFVREAKRFARERFTSKEQAIFIYACIDGILPEHIKCFGEEGMKIAIVLGGKAKKEIPLKKRIMYAEDFNAAFIIY